jgi:hypothetical protein
MRGAGKLRHKIFWAYFASQSSFRRRRALRGRGGRGKEGVEPRGVARPDPASSQLTDGYFFGVDPKKVSLILLHPSTLCQATWLPQTRFFFHKGCWAKDLEKLAGTLSSHSSPRRRSPRPTFLATTPKKPPFFSAPKKPKKSGEGRVKGDPSPPAPSPQGLWTGGRGVGREGAECKVLTIRHSAAPASQH